MADEKVQEFSGKERMIIDWMSVRNAIFRAVSGEMNVTYKRAAQNPDLVVGITVSLDLQFADAVGLEFTEDEKSAIEQAKALKKINPEQL